jgi:hypothetical protein
MRREGKFLLGNPGHRRLNVKKKRKKEFGRTLLPRHTYSAAAN